MNSISETREIDGVGFQFTGELAGDNLRVRCAPQDQRYLPLCGVIETAWRYNPAKLLQSVQEQHGRSFEGEVSFAYYDDYPDELEPGVTVDYLGEELVVSDEMFRRVVVAFAGFWLQASKELQLVNNEEALAPLLAAIED